jgi:signal transduction histidine kinase
MRPSSSRIRTFAIGLTLSSLGAVSAWPAPSDRVLTNAAEIRALGKADAAESLPVRLKGVVIGESEPEGRGFAVQDSSGGIYLEAPRETVAQLHTGDLVEIEGVTDPGLYAPFVLAKKVRKTGKGELPKPRPVTFEELASGTLDSQWVEITGVVRYCEPSPNDLRKCRIELVTGGGRLIVRWNVPNMRTPMVDAEVRLRGVCYYLVNRSRQFLRPMLSIPHDIPVITEVPAPAEPFATPVRSVSSLMQFAPEGSYGHRVHVRGVVIRHQPGESLWIRDEDRGLCIQTAQTEELHPGDEVDVVGFPKQGEYSPILEEAVFQKRPAKNSPSAPLHLSAANEAFNHDADLLELEATLTEREPVTGGWAFLLNSGDGTKFNALLHTPGGQSPPAHSLPGSRVRVVGVCSVIREYPGFSSGLSRPRAFQLLLRSAADLRMIQPPPWWTRQRIIWLFSAITGASLLAVAAILLAARLRLREQAQHRARAEAEFSAILRERNRVAREIHDILAQGLSAIVLHLDLVKDESQRLSNGTARHLEVALGVARDSMADAGNAVWNLRSQVLENNELPEALECVLKQLTDGARVSTRFELTGQPRRLPPVTENALLRIGQEAITNAAKHAQPKHIEVKLTLADKLVMLQVNDDGCGFDADKPRPRANGFGLVGMRERATQLSGKLTVRSQPGKGTEISLTVPVAS